MIDISTSLSIPTPYTLVFLNLPFNDSYLSPRVKLNGLSLQTNASLNVMKLPRITENQYFPPF